MTRLEKLITQWCKPYGVEYDFDAETAIKEYLAERDAAVRRGSMDEVTLGEEGEQRHYIAIDPEAGTKFDNEEVAA